MLATGQENEMEALSLAALAALCWKAVEFVKNAVAFRTNNPVDPIPAAAGSCSETAEGWCRRSHNPAHHMGGWHRHRVHG
jgi:hypothetical protein